MKAEIYIGIAGIDPHFPPEEKQRLETALAAAGVRHRVEVYEGAKHGFAVNDTPAYDKPAAEKHWQRMLELFRRHARRLISRKNAPPRTAKSWRTVSQTISKYI